MTRPTAHATPHTDSPSETENEFWTTYQPGFRFSTHEPGTPEFFGEVERHRYQLEPHIPELAQFDRCARRDVLEVGCGIATDGVQFARHGANYTGIDASPTALQLARRRFELEQLPARLEQASATDLPFRDKSFDLVYSHGVIHHIHDTERAVREFHRVLRPGGKALVMVYHRRSFNYYINIMLVRRLLALALFVPGVLDLATRITAETGPIVQGHAHLLRKHGGTYLTDRTLFLSNNTDGPGNPLSKAYTQTQARELFQGFAHVATTKRHLNLRLVPAGQQLEASRPGRWLARRFGWHLYLTGVK